MQLMQAQHSSSLTASLTMLFLAPVPFREMAHPCASEHGDFPAANMTQFVRLGLVPEKNFENFGQKLWTSVTELAHPNDRPRSANFASAKPCEANHLLSSSITQRVSIAISRNAWHLLRMRGFPNGTSFWFWSLARSVSFSWQYISILWGTSKMSFEFTCSVSRSLRSSGFPFQKLWARAFSNVWLRFDQLWPIFSSHTFSHPAQVCGSHRWCSPYLGRQATWQNAPLDMFNLRLFATSLNHIAVNRAAQKRCTTTLHG